MTLTRDYTNAAGQDTAEHAYFNLGGLTYSTGTMGTVNTNYYQTNYGYDSDGNLVETVTPNGTIYRTVYNSLGEKVSDWVGTNDTPTSGEWSPTNNNGTANMVEVSSYVYDNGGVGDGNLTQETDYPGLSQPNRETEYWYDWRDRLVAQKSGVQANENDGTNRPIIVTTYDNLNEVTETQQYLGDGVTPTISNGALSPLAANSLRAQETDSYDDQGRVYQTQVYDVSALNNYAPSGALTTNYYRDHRGDVIAESDPGGLWTKSVYDGAGRDVMDYTTDGASGTSTWSDISSVTGDTVLEQTQTNYDNDGNVIETLDSQRFSSVVGTGALAPSPSGVQARVYYTASYYDNADRKTADVNVGNNASVSWTRPSTPPASSATVLVTNYGYQADAVQQVSLTGAPTGGTFTLTFAGQTTAAIAYNATAATVQSALQALPNIGANNVLVSGTPGAWRVRFAGSLAGTYQPQLSGNGSGLTGGNSPAVAVATISAGGDAGRQQDVTDPMGIHTETYYDALGRTTQTVQNYLAGDGTLTAEQNVTTEYGYDGNGNVTYVQADEPNNAYEETAYIYGVTTASGSGVNSNDILAAIEHPDPTTGRPNASGQQTESYLVNALGENVQYTDRNGTVHQYRYDVLGRETADAVTQVAPGVDSTVQQHTYAYDSLGNQYLVTSLESGGVVANQVEDVYNGLDQLTGEYQSHSGPVNTLSTPEVQYAYNELGNSQNNSRLLSMTYPDGYKLDYTYNSGLDSNISRLSALVEDSTQTTLESYLYLGLDTVVERDHPQIKVNQTYIAQPGQTQTGDGGDQYVGLDRFGRVADQNWYNTSTKTSTDNYSYSYNQDGDVLTKQNLVFSGLNETYQYDNLHRLKYFARTTSDIQTWTLDALGNFTSVSTDGPTDNRTINQQNQDTNISGYGSIGYDSNGNLNTDNGDSNTLTYDAWNRLVQVSNTGLAVATYQYDGLGRLIYFDDAGGNQPNQPTDQYYSSSGQVLEAYNGGNPQARYVWSPVYVNALVLRDRSSNNDGKLSEERLYVQQDADWNVTALVNLSGSVVQRYQYLPYGAPTVLTPGFAIINIDFPWEDPTYNMQVLWQGMEWDSAMTLYFSQSGRVDSPELLQTWLQTDPRGWSAGPNGYAIEGNNPANMVDPSGLDERRVNLTLRNGMPTSSLAAAGYQSCVLCHGHPSLGWLDLAASPQQISQAPLSQRAALASEPLKLYDQRFAASASAFGRILAVDAPAVAGSTVLTLNSAGGAAPALGVSLDQLSSDFVTMVTGGQVVRPTLTSRLLVAHGQSQEIATGTELAFQLYGSAGLDLLNTGPVAPKTLVSRTGQPREPGTLLTRAELDQIKADLAAMNVDLVENSTSIKFTAQSVGRHQLHLGPNPTWYEYMHEYYHLEHMKGVGYANFSNTSETLREQYVYDQLRLNPGWKTIMTQAERNSAFGYINSFPNGNPVSTPSTSFPTPDLP